MSVRAGLVERLRGIVEARGYTAEQVAARAGLRTPRTVHRVLTGETCSLETLEAIEVGLRVDLLDCPCQEGGQNRSEADRSGQPPEEGRPVVGWRQAALVLDVSARTLRRHRGALGASRGRPWWASPEACRRWWGLVVEGLHA
jgi:transcriptional regulator with XRE-family HTH domain